MEDKWIDLMSAPADRPLDRLEPQIWHKVTERVHARAVARRRVSVQSVILILALIGSIGVGIKATQGLRTSSGRQELALALNLAPSSLLLCQSR